MLRTLNSHLIIRAGTIVIRKLRDIKSYIFADLNNNIFKILISFNVIFYDIILRRNLKLYIILTQIQ